MADRREWLSSAVVVATGVALGWGLLSYGATEAWSVHVLLVLIGVPALLAVWSLPAAPLWRRERWLFLVAGSVVLSQVALRSSLAARGYTLASVAWLALLVSFWTASLSRRAQLAWLVLLAAAGAFEAAYGFAQSLGGVDYIGAYFRDRGRIATGTFIASNHYTGLLNLTWPLAAALPLARGASGAVGRRLGARGRGAIAAAVVLVFGMAVALGRSRGGALAFVATASFVAVLLLLRRLRHGGRARRVATVGAAVLAGVVLLIGVGFAARRYEVLDPGLRLAVYRDTLRLIRDEPLGVGAGMYIWRFRPYQTREPDKLFDHAHNDYLEIAADWGVAVAAILWALVGWRIYRAARLFLQADDPWPRFVALGCAGSLASLVAHGVVDFNLHIPANAMVFALVLGLAWGLDLERRPAVPQGPESPLTTWAIRLVLTLLVVASGWRAFHRVVALRVAEVFPTVDGLRQALAWDPTEPRLHFQLGLDSRDLLESRDLEQARSSLERAAELNPWAWRYHMELARLYELLGEDERAEGEWVAACARNPIGATYHWRLGNFYLRQGSVERALPSFARALALKPALFASTALLVVKAGATGPQLDRLLPGDRASRARLLQFLVGQWRDTDGAEPATELIDREWQSWMASSEPPLPAEGAFYVSHLLRRGSPAAARGAWLELLEASGGAPSDYRLGRNYLWNPDFDGRTSGTELDWSLKTAGPAAARIAAGAGRDGSSALQIDLRGAEDRDLRGLRQWVVTGPEVAYQASFELRWQELTGEVFLEIADGESGRRLWRSEGLSGSGAWRSVAGEVERPEPGESLLLRWRAERSAQPVSGTIWLDGAALGPPASL